MMFNSIPFLISFAVFLILYAAAHAFLPRLIPYLMLAASIAFVAANSWGAAFCALGAAAVNFVLGICVERTAWRRTAMCCAAAINVMVLVLFKLLNVSMLGASFYLFSFLAYLMDVGRGTIRAETKPLRFLSFSFFFPKYIQGPITRYGELAPQLDKPKCSLSAVQTGLTSFIIGFAMKVLISHKLNVPFGEGFYALTTIGYESISTKLAWFGAVVTSLQIFIDWQAYTFMAMGIAGILGYRLPQNFNYPYVARTIGDYYRRWHMTLMRFFKDYVYIPLGGSRAGLLRTVVNVLLVWLLTSLWHGNGLDTKYFVWGVLATAAVIADPIWSRWLQGRNREDEPPEGSPIAQKLLQHIWLLLLLPITVWVLWSAGSGANFLLWGMIIGLCIVLERLWKTFVIQRFRIGEKMAERGVLGTVWKVIVSIFAHIWVLIPILVTWVMFTIRDYGELTVYLGRLFPKAGASAGMDPLDFSKYWDELWLPVLVGILLCFPLPERIIHAVNKNRIGRWVLSVLLAVLFWYAVYRLTITGSDPMGYAAF